MVKLVELSINMSPDAYPTLKMAQISPGPIQSTMIPPFLSYRSIAISPFLPFEGNSKEGCKEKENRWRT
ncbi:hypothetical protein M378DRAFT_174500 [Amanita muscaria Koide BX008]|uniref:Uncharacterized protein n=1 Tax=Amanita muscaria (strain Koide BX008) TaxID=946122 RepID=A0A0C2SJ92_AMAMK|nr:hypothetical protein M378DRAFT_174500 [Amanita muscaria Koide BX008]